MQSAWKTSSTLPSKTPLSIVSKKPVTGCDDELCPRCKENPDECQCHLCIDILEDGEEMTPEQEEYVETVKTVTKFRQQCWNQYHQIREKGRAGLIEFFDKLTFDKLYEFLYGDVACQEDDLLEQK
jgi:hypothetical protein